jgi:hypothetical protein
MWYVSDLRHLRPLAPQPNQLSSGGSSSRRKPHSLINHLLVCREVEKGEGCKRQKWDLDEAVRDFNKLTLDYRHCLSIVMSCAGDFDKHDTRLPALTKKMRRTVGQNSILAQFPTTRAGFLHYTDNRSH